MAPSLAANSNVFPTGTIGVRATPAGLEIDEDFKPEMNTEPQFAEFIVEQKKLVVAKGDLLTYFRETGEIPSWASVKPSENKFYYKTNEMEE